MQKLKKMAAPRAPAPPADAAALLRPPRAAAPGRRTMLLRPPRPGLRALLHHRPRATAFRLPCSGRHAAPAPLLRAGACSPAAACCCSARCSPVAEHPCSDYRAPPQPRRRPPRLRLPRAPAPPRGSAACSLPTVLPLLTGSKLRPPRPLAPPAATLHLRAGATLLLLAGRELRRPPHSSCLICRDREKAARG